MVDLIKYIQEKLVITRNLKREHNQEDWCDATTYRKDDILYSNPNYARGKNKGGNPGIPSFYRVLSNDGKRLQIQPIGCNILHKQNGEGECEADTSHSYAPCYIKIDKNNFAYYGGNVLYYWDGKPEKFYYNEK